LLVEAGLYSTSPFGRTYAIASSIARLGHRDRSLSGSVMEQ
jgi:hypothetical protein